MTAGVLCALGGVAAVVVVVALLLRFKRVLDAEEKREEKLRH